MFHRGPRSGATWLFLGSVAFFAAANGMVFPMMLAVQPDQVLGLYFLAFWYAAFGAQMALHAVWCVFVPLHWIKRFLVGATSALALYGVLVGAFAFSLDFLDEEEWLILVIGLLCLPLLLLAAQAPLWIMRIWFRWRIVHRDDGSSTTFQSLRIRDLMIATAVIAMALTAVQISQSIDASSSDGSIVAVAVAALVVMAISAITVLPSVLATLRSRRLLLAMSVVLSVDIAVVLCYMVILAVFFDAPVLSWETYVGTPIISVGFFVASISPMLIARKLGYRLLWGHR